jgi:hypothetical protein
MERNSKFYRKLCENNRKTNVPISVPAIYPIIVPDNIVDFQLDDLLSFAASDAVTSRKANDTS